MLDRLTFLPSRLLVWLGVLWFSVHVLHGKDVLDGLMFGEEVHLVLLCSFLVTVSLIKMYQILLRQNQIQDLFTVSVSYACDGVVFVTFLLLEVAYQLSHVTMRQSLKTSVLIAISILIGSKWRARSMEIRADRTLLRFIKSFSVHLFYKSVFVASLLFTLTAVVEILSMLVSFFVLRGALHVSLKVYSSADALVTGVWYNFLLEYALVTLEYFLFHPINFSQSPLSQMVPKMGLKAVRTVGRQDERVLLDHLHLLSPMHSAVSAAVPRSFTDATNYKVLVHQTLKALYETNSTAIEENNQWLFASSKKNVNSEHFLQPILGYLECEAVYDLHRIIRSSKLRRNLVLQQHWGEALSAMLRYLINVTLEIQDIDSFVKKPLQLSINKDAVSSSQPSENTNHQSVRDTPSTLFALPRSPSTRQLQKNDPNGPQPSQQPQPLEKSNIIARVLAAVGLSTLSEICLQSYAQGSHAVLRAGAQVVGRLVTLPVRGELASNKSAVSPVEQSSLRESVLNASSSNKNSSINGGHGSISGQGQHVQLSASLRQYCAQCFAPLRAQATVNAVDALVTLYLQALREDTTGGMRSTAALSTVLYVLLRLEMALDSLTELLHQTHSAKMPMSMAGAAAAVSLGESHSAPSSSASAASSSAVDYVRFRVKSTQHLPRALVAVKRSVREAVARLWSVYGDIIVVARDLPLDVHARAQGYRARSQRI